MEKTPLKEERNLKIKLRDLSLGSKLLLILFPLMILFSGLLSLGFYLHLRDRVISNTYEKMNIVFTQMDALGKYVMYHLRPTIFEIFYEAGIKDRFILEAMSTTHVRKIVMEYFKEHFPQVTFERVSPNPINPENRYRDFHYTLERYFIDEPKNFVWRGHMVINNEEYLIIARGIYMERPCFLCHGALKDRPKSLAKYHLVKADFPWQEGDLMGLELVRYPIAEALSEIRAQVGGIFMISILSTSFLLLVLEGLFYSIFIKPLKNLNAHFRALREGKISLQTKVQEFRKDEIGELIDSFNELSSHLYHSQRTIYENLKTLETLFESITHPIALINRCCQIEVANSAFKESPHKHCRMDLVELVIYTKKPLRVEFFDEKERKHYDLALYPVFDRDGEVIRVVQVLQDITEKKLLEERLILTEKLAAIGQMSAGLAHEINNPLSGILLLIRQLQKNKVTEEERRYYYQLIEEALLKIQKLIRELLNFSRSSSLKIERVSLNRIIENLLELSTYLLDREGIRVELNLDPDLPEIYLDKEKIEQVILNLILNAVQAMEASVEKKLLIETKKCKDKVLVIVADTGPGIPEEIKSKIFDPFFTTKPPGKGTGLGLSVSVAIVEKHGGRIYLDRSERGAKFVIELPIKEDHKLEMNHD